MLRSATRRTSMSTVGPDPGHGMTYVRFALDNPAVYRFAFGNPGDDGTPMVDEALQTTAFGRLAGAVGSLVDLGWFPPARPVTTTSVLQMAMQMWTVAHGVASLMIAKPALPWGDDLQVAESVLRAASRQRAAASRRREGRRRGTSWRLSATPALPTVNTRNSQEKVKLEPSGALKRCT